LHLPGRFGLLCVKIHLVSPIMLSLGDSFEYTNSIVGFALQITHQALEFYVFMYLIVIAWIYVVLMMSVAEATNSNGTLLGALVTFVLYGLGPVALVVYLMGAPARSKAIKKRAAQELQQTADAETDAHAALEKTLASHAPDAGGHAAGGAEAVAGEAGVTPVGKEP
jgi:hypothetical protein